MKYSEMIDPQTLKHCSTCDALVKLQYEMTDHSKVYYAIARCKKCALILGTVQKKEK